MKIKACEVKKYDILIVYGEPIGIQSFCYEGTDGRTNTVTFYDASDRPLTFLQSETVEVI